MPLLGPQTVADLAGPRVSAYSPLSVIQIPGPHGKEN